MPQRGVDVASENGNLKYLVRFIDVVGIDRHFGLAGTSAKSNKRGQCKIVCRLTPNDIGPERVPKVAV